MKYLKGMVVFGSLLLVVIAGYFVAGTYAKYVSTVEGSASAAVAKWAFTTDNTGGEMTMTMTETYNASTLVAGKIAPGTTGSFDVEVDNTSTEVGVDVVVGLALKNGCSVDEHATVEACTTAGGTWYSTPTNLKLCSDAACANELTLEGGETTVSGQVAANATLPTKTIYWQWAYETGEAPFVAGDTADTEDGEEAGTMAVDVTITGTQRNPVEETVTGWE